MTRPIHSMKHIKSSYKKIQILVLIFVFITVFSVLLSAMSSYHLGKLNHMIQAERAKAIGEKETGFTKELASINEELATLKNKQKENEKTIKALHLKNTNLQKQLTAALELSRPQPPVEEVVDVESVAQPQPIQNTESSIEATESQGTDASKQQSPSASAPDTEPDSAPKDSLQPPPLTKDSQETPSPSIETTSEQKPENTDSTPPPVPENNLDSEQSQTP